MIILSLENLVILYCRWLQPTAIRIILREGFSPNNGGLKSLYSRLPISSCFIFQYNLLLGRTLGFKNAGLKPMFTGAFVITVG